MIKKKNIYIYIYIYFFRNKIYEAVGLKHMYAQCMFSPEILDIK